MNDTAIVVVTYNSASEIGPCLEAALRTGAAIWVVDNASSDETCRVVRGYPVHLIANPDNRGFAAAVNQGVLASGADYLLLLNPDAVLRTGIERLRDECRQPSVAAAAGLLVGPTGLPQAGFTVRRLPTPVSLCFEVLGFNHVLPHNPVNWRFRCLDLDLTSSVTQTVEQPAGALFMFRRDCWDLVGGFDERFYPLWFEDVDFCARALSLRKKISFVPTVSAKHTGAHSILNMALEIRRIYWYGNLLKYAAKHFSPTGRKLVCLAVLSGSVLRCLVGLPGRGMKDVGVWRDVARLAIRLFFGSPGWVRQPNGGAPSIR